MEIHKPKAAHSVREFLVEIGTITCGILIALGLEQAVEQVHWHHEVETERAALQDEARQSVTTAAYRVALDPCIERIPSARDQATLMERQPGELGNRPERSGAGAHAAHGKTRVQ